ncbi:MAG TPA: hypothetical protein VL979_14190 [Solirubrobacteraceae bacterium]|nr:hypothetical protein [Solirubrobacteraceae bacterium]
MSRSGARYTGTLGLVVLVVVLVIVLLARSSGVSGIAPGRRLPPFAAPLAAGSLRGDADVADRADEGASGRVPACAERGPQILNVCELYERGPVVLAMFVDAGSCANVLASMQRLVAVFPGVRFAAVAIKGERAGVRRLIRRLGLTLPVALDPDGAVGVLYDVFSCPQVDFAYPGGVVQSKPLLGTPSAATLGARVRELVAASRARRQAGAAR